MIKQINNLLTSFPTVTVLLCVIAVLFAARAGAVFIALCMLPLILSLLLCIYEEYFGMRAGALLPCQVVPDYSIYLTQEMDEAEKETRSVLGDRLGFRLRSDSNGLVLYEKGISHRLLNWLFHSGALLLLLGLVVTYLFAYNGTLLLWTNSPDTVKLYETGRLQRLFSNTEPGEQTGETKWSLETGEVERLYAEKSEPQYPDKALSRLALILGGQDGIEEVKSERVVDVRFDARVISNNNRVREQNLGPGSSLRYGFYTFSQDELVHEISLSIDSSPILLRVETGKPFFIPGDITPYKLNSLKSGKLQRLDGGIEYISPEVRLLTGTGNKFVPAGLLSATGHAYAGGHRISIVSYQEGVRLKYRYNPGYWLFLFGGILFLAALLLRFYGYSYLVIYRLVVTKGIVTLQLEISITGLLASRARLARKIEAILSRNDIRPSPLLG